MGNSPLGKPARLGNLLNSLVRKRGIAEHSSGRELEEAWRKVAGERVGSKSYVKRLRGGVLEIGVNNGVILEELTCYLQHEFLPILQQLHPKPEITSLKFVKAR